MTDTISEAQVEALTASQLQELNRRYDAYAAVSSSAGKGEKEWTDLTVGLVGAFPKLFNEVTRARAALTAVTQMATTTIGEAQVEVAKKLLYDLCGSTVDEDSGVALICAALTAAAQAGKEEWKTKTLEFANAILHGDDAHRAWLIEAADAFVKGTKIPMSQNPAPAQLGRADDWEKKAWDIVRRIIPMTHVDSVYINATKVLTKELAKAASPSPPVQSGGETDAAEHIAAPVFDRVPDNVYAQVFDRAQSEIAILTQALAWMTTDRDNSNRLLDDCRHERNVLQKICAERADKIDALEKALGEAQAKIAALLERKE